MAEEEAGSFSPELFHGDENEEVLDPEEDRAKLVGFLLSGFSSEVFIYLFSLRIREYASF